MLRNIFIPHFHSFFFGVVSPQILAAYGHLISSVTFSDMFGRFPMIHHSWAAHIADRMLYIFSLRTPFEIISTIISTVIIFVIYHHSGLRLIKEQFRSNPVDIKVFPFAIHHCREIFIAVPIVRGVNDPVFFDLTVFPAYNSANGSCFDSSVIAYEILRKHLPITLQRFPDFRSDALQDAPPCCALRLQPRQSAGTFPACYRSMTPASRCRFGTLCHPCPLSLGLWASHGMSQTP